MSENQNTDVTAQPQEKFLINSIQNVGPKFLWVEHLDPKDGIGFASGAENAVQPKIRLTNLLDIADGEWSETPSDIPVPSGSGSKDFRSGVVVNKSKPVGCLDSYRLTYDSHQQSIAYNPNPTGEESSRRDNQWFFSNPEIQCQGQSSLPNILIISGHGVGGAAFGEKIIISEQINPVTKKKETIKKHLAGIVSIGEISPPKELNLIILPCCSNLTLENAYRYSKMFLSPSFFGILGYYNTYSGGGSAFEIYRKLAQGIQDGKPIVTAWKDAHAKSGLPWSVQVSESDTEFTIMDMVVRNRKPGHIVHFTNANRTKTRVTSPQIYSFFGFSADSFTRQTTLEEMMQEINMSIRTVIQDGNRVYAWGNQKKGRFFWYTKREDGKPFKAQTSLIFKFCVVRPNWNPLNLSEIFPNGIPSVPGKYTVSYLDESGASGTIVKITFETKCDDLLIILKVKSGVERYIDRHSTHDTKCLLLCLVEGIEDEQGTKLSNGTYFSVDSQNQKSNEISWWRTFPSAIELSIFETELSAE